MFIILPTSFLLIAGCCIRKNERTVTIWCRAAVYWCALLFLQTEILSVFHMLTWYAVFVFWILVSLAAAAYIRKNYTAGRKSAAA